MPTYRAHFSIDQNAPVQLPTDIEKMLQTIEWLVEGVRREMQTLSDVVVDVDSYRDAAAVLFTKATSTLLGVLTLVKAGYGLEADVLARTLLETAIELVYMGKVGDRDDNARRFFDYCWVTKYKDLASVRRLAKEQQLVNDAWVASWERDAAVITEEFEKVRSQFEKPSKSQVGKARPIPHWSGDFNLAERAKAIGEEVPYRIAYSTLSEAAHPGVTEALRHKFRASDAAPDFKAGPHSDSVRRPLLTACKFYLLALHAFGAAFDIDFKVYDDTLDRMMKEIITPIGER